MVTKRSFATILHVTDAEIDPDDKRFRIFTRKSLYQNTTPAPKYLLSKQFIARKCECQQCMSHSKGSLTLHRTLKRILSLIFVAANSEFLCTLWGDVAFTFAPYKWTSKWSLVRFSVGMLAVSYHYTVVITIPSDGNQEYRFTKEWSYVKSLHFEFSLIRTVRKLGLCVDVLCVCVQTGEVTRLYSPSSTTCRITARWIGLVLTIWNNKIKDSC